MLLDNLDALEEGRDVAQIRMAQYHQHKKGDYDSLVKGKSESSHR